MSLDRGLEIREVSVSKPARPARGAIDGNANVDDVVEVAEEAIELRIGGLVGDVANVKSSGGVIDPGAALGSDVLLLGSRGTEDPASVPERAIDSLTCLLYGLRVVEIHEAISE